MIRLIGLWEHEWENPFWYTVRDFMVLDSRYQERMVGHIRWGRDADLYYDYGCIEVSIRSLADYN